MASIDEIRATRLAKLNLLVSKGINPYPIESHQDYTCAEAVEKFDEVSKSEKSVYMVGRIISIRAQGKIVFFHFNDGTGKFQALLKSGEPVSVENFELFEQAFDIGDFVEVKGTLFLTKKEEKTILVEEVRMLAKSLRPLPEKWHGLSDVEERFRKRYLDLVSNPEVKERFIVRSKVVSAIRAFLDKEGYLEAETPVLQPQYGGATAEPFNTHHNALDLNLFLRISDELYLKRLLVGGFPKVYEISKDFRNEGIDMTHWPEFTMLEYYEAYSDAEKQRAFVEEMMKSLSKIVSDNGVITFEDKEIDFNKKFVVKKYADAVSEFTKLKDPLNTPHAELLEEAERVGAKVNPADSSVKIIDGIFKKAVRPNLWEPTFLVDYPIDYLPLTKKKEDNPKLVDAFQFYAGGIELVKAFSELNDPLDQRARFEGQEKVLEKGEKDAQRLDEDFLEAMEYGMPPAGGVGIGIDRLVMLLTNTKNIKEIIFFPTIRPKN
ncbi:MAG: lysine--tRNA ligase [Minisyncoccota bacterium]